MMKRGSYSVLSIGGNWSERLERHAAGTKAYAKVVVDYIRWCGRRIGLLPNPRNLRNPPETILCQHPRVGRGDTGTVKPRAKSARKHADKNR